MTPSASSRYGGEKDLGYERVVFFSDAVFAIAVTLLALDIRLPEIGPERLAAELPGAVLGLFAKFRVYALSFVVIAGFWLEHHRIFRYIERYDIQLVWINIALLLCVAFLPVPHNALNRYPGQEATVLFYALSILVTGFLLVALWGYASGNRRLTAPDLDSRLARYVTLRGVIPTLTAGLAALLAPFAPGAAVAVLALLFVVAVPLGHVYFQVLSRITGARL